MNRFRKAIALSLLLVLCISGIFAASSDSWWEGKAITRFDYTGLRNVSAKKVDELLGQYKGQSFTNELFGKINAVLYSQDWLSYFTAEALSEGEDQSLVIRLDIVENPVIASISVKGNGKFKEKTLLEAQNLKKGDFFNFVNLSPNSLLVREYYLSRGYKDASVEASFTEDSENSSVSIEFTVDEGKQYKVRDILFEGITSIAAKDIEKELTQKAKSFFNSGNFLQENIDKDKAAIISLYNRKGYPDASIKSADIQETGEEEDNIVYLNIVYSVDEGEQWFFGDISFDGNAVFSDEDIQERISIKKGSSYNSENIASFADSLSSLYYDNGYIRAGIELQDTRDPETHQIDINVSIYEGLQSRVEEIRIEGLEKTKPYVLERELTITQGDVFNRSAFIKSQQNMMNTSVLKNIKADLLPGKSEDGVIVVFNVEEGNQMELQFGATFGGNAGGFPVSGFLQWSDTNLAGTGRDLAISTTLSPDTQSISLSLSDDWVGDKRWSNGISLSFERSVKSGVLQRGIGSGYYDGRDSLKISYPLGYDDAGQWYASTNQVYPSSSYLMSYDYYRLSVGYNTGYTFAYDPGSLIVSGGISLGLNHAVYDDGKYDPYEYLIVKYHEGWQFSNKLSFSLSWDGRDLKKNTTRGYYLSASFTYAGGVLQGLSNYNRLSLSGSAYHSLFSYVNDKDEKKSLVLSFSTSASFMLPQYWNGEQGWKWYEASLGATKYEMLYIDGMNIGRGFSVQYDKSFLWHNQIDLTFPLVQNVIALEGFISATGATATLEQITKSIDWFLSGGIGIKMQIPGFPLGLYVVKNATITEANGFKWDSGFLFSNGKEGSGMKLVLAITTSIY